MNRFKLVALAGLALIFSDPAVFAQMQTSPSYEKHTLDKALAEISVTYSALRSNAPVGGCGCFWTEGGSAELAVPIWRYVSGVAEISGEHTDHIPGSGTIGLSLISGLGGVRVGRPMHTRYIPFAQGLFGGVHAFDSSFPGSATSLTYATSFAMAAGGGLDVSVSRHMLIRPIQAEYQYMQLPNNSTNQQHDIRLSAGVVFRFLR